jgi:hypothetical protein
LAEALGVAGALYLCGGLELLAIAPLLAIRDIRRISRPPVTLAD